MHVRISVQTHQRICNSHTPTMAINACSDRIPNSLWYWIVVHVTQRRIQMSAFYDKALMLYNFFHAQLNWTRTFHCSQRLKYRHMKTFLALSPSDVVLIMLINVKMPTIVVLSWVEHEQSFITLGQGLSVYVGILLLSKTLQNYSWEIIFFRCTTVTRISPSVVNGWK